MSVNQILGAKGLDSGISDKVKLVTSRRKLETGNREGVVAISLAGSFDP